MRVVHQVAILLGLGGTLIAPQARAESPWPIENKWCVRADGLAGDFSGCGGPAACSGTFVSIADAIGAASVAVDPDPSDPATHMVCVDGDTPHQESVSVDNSSGILGDYVGVQFVGASSATWCDDGSLVRSAGWEVTGTGASDPIIEILDLRTDSQQCARTRPVAHAEDTRFGLIRAVVQGGPGPVLSSLSVAPGASVVGLYRSTVEGVVGPVASCASTLEVVDSGLYASHATGVPLVLMSGSTTPGAVNAAYLDVSNSTLAGNLVEQAPLLQTGEGILMSSASLHGNLVTGAPLLQVGPATPAFRAKHLIIEVEFSENRLLAAGPAVQPAVPNGSLAAPQGSPAALCDPVGAQGVGAMQRALPSGQGAVGVEPLVRFSSPGASTESYRVHRSYFAGNELGGGLFDFGAGQTDSSLYLVHNVFGPHGVPLLVGGDGTGPCRLGSIRNLYLEQPSLDLGNCWSRFEATMDVVAGSADAWNSSFPGSGISVVGPMIDGGDLGTSFTPQAAALSSDSCTRSRLACPSVSVGCPGGIGWCPQGAGAGLHLAEAAWEGLTDEYPWPQTLLSPLPADSATFELPGPSGWDCGGREFPQDAKKGDNDGYTDFVDCDNADPTVVPVVPQYSGVGMPWCNPDLAGCYVCPEESCWPPGEGGCRSSLPATTMTPPRTTTTALTTMTPVTTTTVGWLALTTTTAAD